MVAWRLASVLMMGRGSLSWSVEVGIDKGGEVGI